MTQNHIYRLMALFSFMLMSIEVSGQHEVEVILKSRALLKAGRSKEAINLLSKSISESNGSRLYMERAEVFIMERDFSGAIRDFNQANIVEEHSGDYGLAKVYAIKGDASTSMYHLGMHLESEYKNSEKEIMLEPAFQSVENSPEWRQFWKKEWYDYPEKIISEIEFLVSKGNIEESKIVLDELKRNYSGSEEALYSEALINLGSGRYSESVSALSRLIVENPSSERYLRVMARGQIGQLNPAGASVTYTRLLESGVADADLLLMRADCYRKTKETDKAISDIEKFLELYPEDKSALSMAGKVEAESGDNLKALGYFSKNLSLHPNDPDCYIDRANSYFASRSWDWAVRDYAMSLDLKPDNSDAWLNKGIAQQSSGKIDDACHDFKRAYSLGNQKASAYIAKHCLNK